MTRLGALLALLGFGSAVVHFLNVRQFALMAWAAPWQPFLGLGVGAVGAVLLLIPMLTNKDQSAERAAEGYGAPGGPAQQASFGQQGFPPPASPPGGFPQPAPQGYGPPPASPPGGFPRQPAGYGAPASPPGGFPPPGNYPPIPQQGPQYGPRPPQGPPPPRGPVQDFGPQGGPPFGPQGR